MLRPAFTAALLSVWLSAAHAADNAPTLQQRDAIVEKMSGNMVLPQTADWRFEPVKPYLGSEKLICGRVNYQSASRVYAGFHRFYALLDGDTVTLSQIENAGEDATGRLRAKIDTLCGADNTVRGR